MDKQIITVIMQFMARVQLTGQEVPAFNAAMEALRAEIDSQKVDERVEGS